MKKYLCLFITLSFLNLYNTYAIGLTANVAEVDLTPPLEMKFALGGYGERMSKPAEGVHDRIWAKVLVLKKNDKKYAIVTLDILGLPPNVKPQLVKILAVDGWNEENMMLLPSHTHTSFDMSALNDKNKLNSPQIGIFQPELLEHVVTTLSKLIREADKNYRPVHIGTSSIAIEGMNRNRRGDPAVDNELTVTRIDYENGKPMAALINWTAHPTFMDEKNMLVSGGWPGYLQRELEQWIGNDVTIMYYNGAEGDQSPIGINGVSNYEKAEIYGRTLAIKSFDIYLKIETKFEIEFNYNYKILNLPEQKVHPSFMKTGGAEYNLTPEALDIILNVMSPETSSIGIVRVGDLMIVGVPGEMAAGLGLSVKKELIEKGIKYPTIGGLANEWISYILSADQYKNGGGYEASISFYGERLGEVILRGIMDTSLPLTRKNNYSK